MQNQLRVPEPLLSGHSHYRVASCATSVSNSTGTLAMEHVERGFGPQNFNVGPGTQNNNTGSGTQYVAETQHIVHGDYYVINHYSTTKDSAKRRYSDESTSVSEAKRRRQVLDSKFKSSMKILLHQCDLPYPDPFETRRRNEIKYTPIAANTCQWLFEEDRFKKWETSARQSIDHAPFLILKGKAGSGKSVQLYQALQHSELKSSSASENQITISFFFHAREGVNLECSPLALYTSLLRQLSEKIPSSPDVIASLRHYPDCEWDLSTLQIAISAMLREVQDQKIFIFIDALDECREERQDVEQNLSDANDILIFLKERWQEGADIRVCFSTRGVMSLKRLSIPSFVIDVAERNQNDIDTYLKDSLGMIKMSSDTRKNLERTLSKLAANMFLWAKLVVRKIEQNCLDAHYENDEQMLHEASNFPEGLDSLYKTLLKSASKRDEAVTLLQLVQVAVRPLTFDEVRSALGKAINTTTLPEASNTSGVMEESYRIHKSSGGLVEVALVSGSAISPHLEPDQEYHIVRLIHQSVREFLDRGELEVPSVNHPSDPEAHAHLRAAKLCMKILSTPEAASIADSDDANFTRSASFLPYASQHWILHARKSDKLMNDDFSIPIPFATCSARTIVIFKLLKKYERARMHTERDEIPNARAITCRFRGRQCSESSDAGACQEKLLVLLAHEGCTSLFLAHAAKCIKAGNCHRHSHVLHRAFWFAVHGGWAGTTKAVWALANDRAFSIDVNAFYMDRLKPLFIACSKGRIHLVEFLLSIGADVFGEAKVKPWLPMHAAVAEGYDDVALLLLEYPAHLDKVDDLISRKNEAGETILHHVARTGRIVLLDKLVNKYMIQLILLLNEISREGTALQVVRKTMKSVKSRIDEIEEMPSHFQSLSSKLRETMSDRFKVLEETEYKLEELSSASE